jgi:type 1 fimbria pilin
MRPPFHPRLFSAFASLLLGATAGAHAADTVELVVKGTIRPSACLASFPGNSVIDFGTIKSDPQLKERFKDLPAQRVDMRISCDGPTKIAVKAVDNREATREKDIPGFDAGDNFGLGLYRGKSIGGYAVRFGTAVADGQSVGILGRPNGSAAWSNSTLRGLRQDGSQLSFGAGNTPVAFSELVAGLDISAKLSRVAYQLLADDIQLDGSISIEMLYL